MDSTQEDEQDGLQRLMPSLSPMAAMGVNYDDALASGDPASYMAAMRAGVPYQSPNARPTPAPPSQPSAMAAAAGKEQAAVAPASTPSPATGTATQQPESQSIGRDDTPYMVTPDLKNPMDGFGTSLAAQSQVPATNAPNPAAETDKTGAPTVPGTVTPSGTAEDPNQSTLQQASKMGIDFAKNLASAPTLASQEQAIQAKRTLPPQEFDPAHPEYKPSAGRRFLRGLVGVGEGVARGGIRGGLLGGLDPEAVGATPYSAPTRQFSIAAQRQAAQSGALDKQQAATEKSFSEDTGRAKDVIQSINEIGRNAAAGQNAQARMDTAAAREETARVSGQLADIKQQVADFQSQGRIPNNFEATSAAWALEKDPTRKAALKAALDYDRDTELKKFQYKAAADGEPKSAFRQSMIDAATEQVKALQDKYTYNARRNQYENPNNPNDVLNPNEFTDKKNEISAKLDQQLGQKKMKPLGVRFNASDAGGGKPTGRAATQQPQTAPAAQPAKKAVPPTPTAPAPQGAADMALGSDGQWHYRDGGKKDLGVVK